MLLSSLSLISWSCASIFRFSSWWSWFWWCFVDWDWDRYRLHMFQYFLSRWCFMSSTTCQISIAHFTLVRIAYSCLPRKMWFVVTHDISWCALFDVFLCSFLRHSLFDTLCLELFSILFFYSLSLLILIFIFIVFSIFIFVDSLARSFPSASW